MYLLTASETLGFLVPPSKPLDWTKTETQNSINIEENEFLPLKVFLLANEFPCLLQSFQITVYCMDFLLYYRDFNPKKTISNQLKKNIYIYIYIYSIFFQINQEQT